MALMKGSLKPTFINLPIDSEVPCLIGQAIVVTESLKD